MPRVGLHSQPLTPGVGRNRSTVKPAVLRYLSPSGPRPNPWLCPVVTCGPCTGTADLRRIVPRNARGHLVSITRSLRRARSAGRLADRAPLLNPFLAELGCHLRPDHALPIFHGSWSGCGAGSRREHLPRVQSRREGCDIVFMILAGTPTPLPRGGGRRLLTFIGIRILLPRGSVGRSRWCVCCRRIRSRGRR